jgi:hypothetical protein
MQKVWIKHFRPDARIEPNGRWITLSREYEVGVGPHHIIVPAGTMTDFASIPRLFWRLCPPWGLYSRAAIVHDYLYTEHAYKCPDTGRLIGVDRRAADRIFLKLMLYSGVAPLLAKCLYAAVRLFGARAWDKQGG